MKDEEMIGRTEECGEVKSLKLRFHPNNRRSEAMICFSTEEDAQQAITEISYYGGWRPKLHKPTKKSRDNQIIATRNMNKDKTTKVQLNK